MSEPFLAEVRIVGFNFPPRGWSFCDGQILPINQNQSLYSLLGTIYGGDGRTSFGLPDLRGRTPIHPGPGYTLGQRDGAEAVTLTEGQTPAHTHAVVASAVDASQSDPTGNLLARSSTRMYSSTATASAASSVLTSVGGGQAHENMQPYQVLNYCIALQGLFPSRN